MPRSALPNMAYFGAGGGPLCSSLITALRNAGFFNIDGTPDERPASALWIAPTGEPKEEVSPPGTGPRRLYDTGSLITILLAHSQLPPIATFRSEGQYQADEIRDALDGAGFKNVFGAVGKEKVGAVWISPREYRVAPASRKCPTSFETGSLVVLVPVKASARGKPPRARKQPTRGKPRSSRKK